jgi:hypothetical protein
MGLEQEWQVAGDDGRLPQLSPKNLPKSESVFGQASLAILALRSIVLCREGSDLINTMARECLLLMYTSDLTVCMLLPASFSF